MSDSQKIDLQHFNDVLESKNYIETNADGVVTIGTQNNGYDIFNFVFLNSTPVIGHEDGEIVVTGMHRTKVASVTLSKQKAFDFYQSLKNLFEE